MEHFHTSVKLFVKTSVNVWHAGHVDNGWTPCINLALCEYLKRKRKIKKNKNKNKFNSSHFHLSLIDGRWFSLCNYKPTEFMELTKRKGVCGIMIFQDRNKADTNTVTSKVLSWTYQLKAELDQTRQCYHHHPILGNRRVLATMLTMLVLQDMRSYPDIGSFRSL